MKKLLKKIIPPPWLLFYHKALAVLSDFFYFSPSRKMIVIGVTGTNGKTTVCHLIRDILEAAGFKVGMTTSIDFQDGKKFLENNTKQGMPGRFALRKFLARMVKNNCEYAVIETTSEGIKQFRHYKIDYRVAVFTNLTRDHIESHGSFEAYRKAKEELFKITSQRKDGVNIINLDDAHALHFLQYKASQVYGYGLNQDSGGAQTIVKIIAENIKLYPEGSVFSVNNKIYTLAVPGKHNISNALASLCVGLSQKIPAEKIQKALAAFSGIPGRLEEVKNNRGFRIFVDYAHTEDALQKVYETLSVMPRQKMIAVLGATGGGRDKKKRPALGALASKYCNRVFVTNEDPYDENPEKIINEVLAGVIDGGKKLNVDCYRISDRGEAIKKALAKAQREDIVIITGKGCEKVMATRAGLIPWDDREIVKKALEDFGS